MRRKHRRKNQKKIIIFSMIGLVCLFSVGYAAFSSEFLISGKGTIVEQTITSNKLKELVVINGDGLYKDPVETNRYVYRGANPDNYIWLDLNGDTSKTDNEIYRIVALEADNTIKVVAKNSLGNMTWDTSGNRTTSGYCTFADEYGCNAWGSSTTTLDANGNNVTVMPREAGSTTTYALPSNEASLNTYLNGTFLNGLSTELQNKIATHTFNIGPLNYASGQTLATDISQESTYKWNGKIALVNATDYVRASTNSACNSVYKYTQNCYNDDTMHNYLFHSIDNWSLTPYSQSTFSVNIVYSFGSIGATSVHYNNMGTFPSFYLTSDISLSGEGTSSVPYEIVN